MKFQNTKIVFSQPNVVELQKETLASSSLRASDILIETEYSIVSPGTELACLSGSEWWAPMPFSPGYGSVGRVRAIGGEIKDVTVGQRIFTYGRHAKYSLSDVLTIPLKEGIDPNSRGVCAHGGGIHHRVARG